MAEQKHMSSDKIRSSGLDIKFIVLDITRQIILGSRYGIMTIGNEDLFAWGAMIESFDSFIQIYYLNDIEYQTKRNGFKGKILKINPYDKSIKNKLELKRTYDEWFALICIKLAKDFPIPNALT